MRRIRFEQKLAELGVSEEEFTFLSKMFVRYPFTYLRKNGYDWTWFQTHYPLERNAIANHFRGQYWVATFSRQENDYVVIDLDHGRDLETRYERLIRLMPHPIVFQSSNSGGLHLYYFLEQPVGTKELRDRIAAKLDDAGIEVAPGRVEIFPAPKQAIRIPLGLDSYLVDGDTLTPLHNDLAGGLKAFRIEFEPWSLEELLALPGGEGWDKEKDQNFELVDSGLSGSTEFKARVRELLQVGLTEPRTRNQAEHMLVFHFWSQGLDEEAIYHRLKEWYSTKTNGLSKDWNTSPNRVLGNLRRTIRAQFEWARESSRTPHRGQLVLDEKLTVDDVRHILGLTSDYKTQQFLFSLFQYAKSNRDALGRLPLARDTLFRLEGSSWRTYQERLSFCEEVGLLRQTREYHRSARLSREYAFEYQFSGDGMEVQSLDEGIARLWSSYRIKVSYSRRTSDKIIAIKLSLT